MAIVKLVETSAPFVRRVWTATELTLGKPGA